MHAPTDGLPDTPPPSSELLPGRSPGPTPRIVTTGSLTSHVHTLAGPSGSSGPVFVLLHGTGMSHRNYRRLQTLMARHGTRTPSTCPVSEEHPNRTGSLPSPTTRTTLQQHFKSGRFPRRADRALDGDTVRHRTRGPATHVVSHIVLLGPVVDPERRTVRQQTLALGLDGLRETPMGNAKGVDKWIATREACPCSLESCLPRDQVIAPGTSIDKLCGSLTFFIVPNAV